MITIADFFLNEPNVFYFLMGLAAVIICISFKPR